MNRHDCSPQLNQIIWLLKQLVKQGEVHMAREQEMLDELVHETDAGNAVVKLLDMVAQDLADIKAGMDPAAQAKVDEAITKIKANAEKWAAAVVRDTPADPHVEHGTNG